MNLYKYPRTYHFPWSQGVSDDDKIGNPSFMEGREIVVLEKLDGECTAIYPNGQYHARSVDGSGYPWQTPMINEVLSTLYNDGGVLSEGERIYGENMYAKHSIEYNDLDAWFYCFALWREDTCSSYDRMLTLPFHTPRELYRGVYDESILKQLANDLDLTRVEGYVARVTSGFHLSDFNKSVLKFVREGHVQTDTHWRNTWTPNNKKHS